MDYPGIGPEHSFFKECGRAEYASATDAEALEAFSLVSRMEGIIPALETSHAFSYLGVPFRPSALPLAARSLVFNSSMCLSLVNVRAHECRFRP